MLAVLFASRFTDAFVLAALGALAVTSVSMIVGWIRWLSRLDTRLNAINARIDDLEETRVGPSNVDLDDRIGRVERDRGPMLDVLHHRLDALDERITALEQPPPPPRPVPPQPRRRK
jgi:hypothetical protein